MPTFRYDRPPDEFAVRREDRFPVSNGRLFVMQSSSPDLAAFVDDVRWPSPASDNWIHPHGCFLMAQDLRTGLVAKSTDGTLQRARRRYLPDGALHTVLLGFKGRLALRVWDFVVPNRDIWVRRVEVATALPGVSRIRLIYFLAPRTGDEAGVLRAERLPSGFLFYGCGLAPFVALHCDRPLDAWLLAGSAYPRAGVGDLPSAGGDLPAPGNLRPTDRLELAAAVDLLVQRDRVVVHFALAFGERAGDVEAPGPLRSMYAVTRRWWRGWLAGGVTVQTPSRRINGLYRTSLVIARMCQASNGAVTYAGCGDYGARAWARDAVWYAIGMDYAGHHHEAERALEWCASLKRKNDGTFYANYLVDGDRPDWEQPEYDQLGLILAGFWVHHLFAGREEWLAHHWPFLRSCADAIVGLTDDSGLVREDTSIWEDRLAQNTFTSGVCAFGLWCAARIAGTLGHRGLAASWRDSALRIRRAVLARTYNAARGCLVESPGSRYVDGAVLTLGSWFPILRGSARFERGLSAIVTRLWHDGLRGLRRREMEDNTPRQDWDKFPWPGVTLWAVDALVEAGRSRESGRRRWPRGRLKQAARCLRWVAEHAMPEGILGENVHPGGHSRFPMPSYSSVGFARTLIRLGGLMFDGQLRSGRPVILPGIGRVRLRGPRTERPEAWAPPFKGRGGRGGA